MVREAEPRDTEKIRKFEMHVPPRVIRPQGAPTEWVAKATLPTRHGNFETHIFRGAGDHGLSPEHVALKSSRRNADSILEEMLTRLCRAGTGGPARASDRGNRGTSP